LAIGNPTEPSGEFFEMFKRPGVVKIHISALDTPNFTTFGITIDDIRSVEWLSKITGPLPAPWLITPEWVADKWQKWGEDSPLWISRVLGKFPEPQIILSYLCPGSQKH
jgi:phage terminase large subunit